MLHYFRRSNKMLLWFFIFQCFFFLLLFIIYPIQPYNHLHMNESMIEKTHTHTHTSHFEYSQMWWVKFFVQISAFHLIEIKVISWDAHKKNEIEKIKWMKTTKSIRFSTQLPDKICIQPQMWKTVVDLRKNKKTRNKMVSTAVITESPTNAVAT